MIMIKNIHILPTDKPSRLLIKEKSLLLVDMPKNYTFFGNIASINIYITSDEEIKDGEYGLSRLGEIIKFHSGYDYRYYSKIILTTDPDLIADGVQAISDEFLEWFVKNPGCENVKVEKLPSINGWIFTPIIPKEDSKQEPCDNCNNEECCCIVKTQETLEEALKTITKDLLPQHRITFEEGVEFGTKWQAERMYSEEEVRKAIQLARLCTLDSNTGEFVDLSGLTEVCTYGLKETRSEDSIIEQFKKK